MRAVLPNASPAPSHLVIAEPRDETVDTLINRCLGPKPYGALKIRYVCTGLRDVTSCIGSNSRIAGLPVASSISRTTSVTSTGWLLPIL